MSLTIGPGVTINTGVTLNGGPAASGGPTPNSIVVATLPYNNTTYTGANDGTNIWVMTNMTFGTITSDYISEIAYQYAGDKDQTDIILKTGNYTGFTVDANGAIDGDLPSYRRNFTIGNSSYYFTYNGVYAYTRYTDVASLTSSVGSTLSLVYNPNAQTSYSNDTLWIEGYSDNYVTLYGCNTDYNTNPVFGQLRSDSIQYIYYNQGASQTRIKMIDGTFTGFSVSSGAIDSDTNGSNRVFTINASTYTFTFNSSQEYYTAVGDALSLVNNVGSNWSVIYDPNAQGGGGSSGTGTYTISTDYSDGSSGPPGISFMSPGGPYTSEGVIVDPTAWVDSDGATALLALTSGSTFTVSTTPAGGGSPVTATITLTSSWATLYGSAQRADISTSTSVSTSYPNYVPFSVTIGGGVFVEGTDWLAGPPPGLSVGGSGGQYNITVFDSAWNNTSARDAILATTTGQVFTCIIGGNTITVTLTSTWSSFGPGSYASVTVSSWAGGGSLTSISF